MKVSRIIISMSAAATLAVSRTAHAANADKGTWDDSDNFVSCTSGTNSRTCTYDMYSYGCQEASTIGVTLAPCSFYLHARVTVVPLLNGAGQVIGCTSSALSATGYGEFDSTFSEFDNFDMEDTVIFEVKDTFGDGKPGVAKFTIVDADQEGTPTWVATGSFVTSCGRSINQYDIGGAGSVTVQV